MKHPARDSIPCWFEISWQDGSKEHTPAIVFKFHKDIINLVRGGPHIVTYLQEDFSFKSYCDDIKEGFGFNGAFVPGESSGDFEEMKLSLPKIRTFIDEECKTCKGSGKMFTDSNRGCSDCSGSGREDKIDFTNAYAASASIHVLNHILQFPAEEETTCGRAQLLTFGVGTRKSMHGGSIGGVYSPTLVDWFRSYEQKGNDTVVEASTAMRKAYKFMWKESRKYLADECNSRLQGNGGIHLSCPGNACGIDPSYYYEVGRGAGYEFAPHNVDGPLQQLTLLAGLAVLHDIVRREKGIKKS